MSADEIHPSMELSHQIECALNRVLEDMKKASELFHHSASEGDALEAANLQLLATFRFWAKFFPKMMENTDPLLRLYIDLRSLQKGARPSMLKPKFTNKHPPADLFYHGLKGVVVFTLDRLRASGMKGEDPRRAVAAVLNKQGVLTAGGLRITARTIRKWEDDVGVDPTASKILGVYESDLVDNFLDNFFEGAPKLPDHLAIRTVPVADAILQKLYGKDIRHVFLGWLRNSPPFADPKKPPTPAHRCSEPELKGSPAEARRAISGFCWDGQNSSWMARGLGEGGEKHPTAQT
jgi:hypothetical protein